MVRNPLDRITSHYRHGFGAGNYEGSLSGALKSDPALVDHSRYAWQLEPWRETIGDDRIFVMQFEAYVQDRRGAVEAVERWLGLEPETSGIDPDQRKNASEGKTAPPGFLAAFTRHPFYKTRIAPRLSSGILSRLKRFTHRRMPEAHVEWSPEWRNTVKDMLAQDVEQISRLCRYPSLLETELLWSDFKSNPQPPAV
jgi:hypothetical protein